MKRHREAGFTLLELVLVMLILGILAARLVPNFVGRSEDAKRSRAISDLEAISTALDAFELDNGFFPSTNQGLQALVEQPQGADNWKGPYLRRLPRQDPWGNPYQYRCPGIYNTNSYDLYSLGRDGREGGTGPDEDITNWD
ncbi:MAG: type II secretion system major pseudopilin GspG [Firmicutes bacterium]|nr:type II secretion system major pseudopilin GspG [Bacillota bacterium]HQD39431.1 type II secretion system major pseudopilin GspG [Bacillota bacterium]